MIAIEKLFCDHGRQMFIDHLQTCDECRSGLRKAVYTFLDQLPGVNRMISLFVGLDVKMKVEELLSEIEHGKDQSSQ